MNRWVAHAISTGLVRPRHRISVIELGQWAKFWHDNANTQRHEDKRPPARSYDKRPSKTLHDLRRREQHEERMVVSVFAAKEDLDQALSPINVWKDDERDETIYTPRIMGVKSGPVSSLLTTGDVLFQSRRYVSPIIVKVHEL
jgi:hypothetical protein